MVPAGASFATTTKCPSDDLRGESSKTRDKTALADWSSKPNAERATYHSAILNSVVLAGASFATTTKCPSDHFYGESGKTCEQIALADQCSKRDVEWAPYRTAIVISVLPLGALFATTTECS